MKTANVKGKVTFELIPVTELERTGLTMKADPTAL
jgi:hypothetical protein